MTSAELTAALLATVADQGKKPVLMVADRHVLLEKLEDAKLYPRVAYRHNTEGTTSIAFTINQDGTACETTIQASSGSDGLDSAAMNMVTTALPLLKQTHSTKEGE